MGRDIRLDTIKGLLIILVVMGHVIIELDNINFVNHAVMGLIYIFHMPLFILLSGYLTKHPDQQDPGTFWRGQGRLFVTLIVFQVLFSFKTYLYGGYFLDALQRFPFAILWYLLSLIFWRAILYYTPRWLLNKPMLYLGIAVVLSLVSGLTHLGVFLSIQRTLNFFLFFLMGFYYRQGPLNTKLWHNNTLYLIIVIILLPLIFWLFPHCGNIMNGADYHGISGLPEKALILLCSVSMSLLVFNLTPADRFFSAIGKDSLFYYIYHMFFVTLTLSRIANNYNLPHSFPFILLYTAIIMCILWLMSKIKLFWWLLHPTFKRRESSHQ